MKKQALLFMAGGMLALASCQNEPATGTSDAQVDSMVNARVEELRTEMMAQNDSLINAMAIEKADSICGAKKGGTVVKKTTPKPAPTKPVKEATGGRVDPVPTEPTNTGKNNGQGQNTGKVGTQSEGQNTGKRR